jgi:hypothetical protein
METKPENTAFVPCGRFNAKVLSIPIEFADLGASPASPGTGLSGAPRVRAPAPPAAWLNPENNHAGYSNPLRFAVRYGFRLKEMKLRFHCCRAISKMIALNGMIYPGIFNHERHEQKRVR